MRWTPSIVPSDVDQTVYLVADDFGPIGRAWREADLETADLETVIQDLIAGEYANPIRVSAFNTSERWSEDVSEDIAFSAVVTFSSPTFLLICRPLSIGTLAAVAAS
ncbi:hypothetical protein IC762_30340 [Bradyrhizobium genosp. L]|uniref:hypothetical protein n=1 Tax=Bradyrhizobium genosp. L TaxID=83637 RepID=UPI0018A24DD2|nr:hypothetical protein [Bradyrhizobium genosp. L]QPF83914.1 hypothetical protein IC762_30340 [Bradyrhizobium genosp. L]